MSTSGTVCVPSSTSMAAGPALLSRNDREVTSSYPELRALGEALGSLQVVLDGEIVALDARGRPSFEALQPRMNTSEPSRVRRLAEAVPVTYMIFDLMHLDGHSALDIAYSERRSLLEGLELSGPSWATPAAERGGGAAVLKAAQDAGLEGIVAKRLDSPYRPGVRDPELAQGEELPHSIGGDRGLGRRPGPPRGRPRGAACRGPERRRPFLRGQDRHRFQCR